MGLIERKWTLIVDSNDHIRGYVAGTNRIVSGVRMDDREVEVMPAADLRGAVGALEACRRERDELGDRLKRASANAEAAEAELDRLTGGQ